MDEITLEDDEDKTQRDAWKNWTSPYQKSTTNVPQSSTTTDSSGCGMLIFFIVFYGAIITLVFYMGRACLIFIGLWGPVAERMVKIERHAPITKRTKTDTFKTKMTHGNKNNKN